MDLKNEETKEINLKGNLNNNIRWVPRMGGILYHTVIDIDSSHIGKIVVEAHSLHEALDLVDVAPCSFGRVPILNSRCNTGGIHWDFLFVFPSDRCLVD